MEWNRIGSNLAQIIHMAQNYFSFRFIGTQVIEESNINNYCTIISCSVSQKFSGVQNHSTFPSIIQTIGHIFLGIFHFILCFIPSQIKKKSNDSC